MDLPGGMDGSGEMFFVQVETAEGGTEVWMVLIFCNSEALFIHCKLSELPLMLPYHCFLLPAKIMHSIVRIGDVLSDTLLNVITAP